MPKEDFTHLHGCLEDAVLVTSPLEPHQCVTDLLPDLDTSLLENESQTLKYLGS